MSKPAIVMAIPPDWHQLSLMELRDQLASALPSVTGAIRRSLEAGIADIDSGRIHFVVEGPSAIKPWTASVILSVDTGDVSLEAAVTRIVAEDLAVIGPSVTQERAEIDLPIGKSIRVMTTRNPLGGASSESVEYVVILADGSTLYMAGTSRDGDQPFIEAMDKMALSLAN